MTLSTYSQFPIVEVAPASPAIVEVDTVEPAVIEVSTDEPPVIDIVAVGATGPKGDTGPEVVWLDFSRRGLVVGPYNSPLRRYVDRPATLDRVVVSLGSTPTAGAFTVDVLSNGLSVFVSPPQTLPTINPGSYSSYKTLAAPLAAGDYLQVSVLSGMAADMTVSIHLTYDPQ